ncbi:hypothetical protein ACQEVZ_40005 [Dactylosporangium sp. CA-152071]|uniref:hypothetical protein n=1 Tax=Dactylosporangium sp. CA-152071 TaxID=3239933 RepID=UPI003D939EC5
MGADYNTGGAFTVDQKSLDRVGFAVNNLRKEISEELVLINKRWSELAIGWAGPTQQRADEFRALYNAVIIDFFGENPDDDEAKADGVIEPGALNRFAAAISGAAAIYELTEQNLYYNFKWMADLVTDPNHDVRRDKIPQGMEYPAGGTETGANTGDRRYFDGPIQEYNQPPL